MRHRKSGRKLGRTHSHRKATLSNLATALFEHKKIKTTTAKAKELRSVAERLVTYAKKDSLHARRMVLRTIRDKEVVKSLFEEIAPKYEDRNGGYTRVIKLGRRSGDAAEVSIIELVGFESVQKKSAPKPKTDAKSKTKPVEEVAETAPVVGEAPAAEDTDVVEEVADNVDDVEKEEK